MSKEVNKTHRKRKRKNRGREREREREREKKKRVPMAPVLVETLQEQTRSNSE